MDTVGISTKNFPMNDALHEYVHARVRPIVRLIDPDDTSVQMSVRLERTTNHHRTGDVYRAECTLHVAGKDFVAESVESTIHLAIDEVMYIIKRDIRKHRSRQRDSVRKGGRLFKKSLTE